MKKFIAYVCVLGSSAFGIALSCGTRLLRSHDKAFALGLVGVACIATAYSLDEKEGKAGGLALFVAFLVWVVGCVIYP